MRLTIDLTIRLKKIINITEGHKRGLNRNFYIKIFFRTRILVTHNLGFLHQVDKILIFDNGTIVDEGTLEQLQQGNSR